MRNAAAIYAVALLLGVTVATAQEARPTTDTKVKSDDGQVIKMTGCVEIGGGTGFVLTNITSEQTVSDKVRTGTHAPPVGSYALVERKGLALGTYIQQKVELTGVVVPAATQRDSQDTIEITETTRDNPDSTRHRGPSEDIKVKVKRGAAAQFIVASVKTLSLTCQP